MEFIIHKLVNLNQNTPLLHNYNSIIFAILHNKDSRTFMTSVVVYYRWSGEGCGTPKQRSATVWATSATSASPGADPTSSSFPPPCSKAARSQQGNIWFIDLLERNQENLYELRTLKNILYTLSLHVSRY